MTMEPCCALKYFPQLDVCQREKDGDLDAKKKALQQAEEEDFGNTQCAQWRAWVWSTIGNIKFLKLKMANQLHEYRVPLDLQACAVLALFSLSMVILSTITFIISTADELQMDEGGESEWPLVVLVIEMTDNFVVVFFTLEFLVRLAICPNKIKFIRDPMNIIDICAIVPFYLSLLLEGLEDFEIIGKTGKMIRLVRVMRILRIFKLVRHFAGLQSLFYTLQQAYQVS